MVVGVAEATYILVKYTALVGLNRPLEQLGFTKMLSKSLEPEEYQ
jgi:hypothetical protein